MFNDKISSKGRMTLLICKIIFQLSQYWGPANRFFLSFESNLESAVQFLFESNLRIESAVYHASRNTA